MNNRKKKKALGVIMQDNLSHVNNIGGTYMMLRNICIAFDHMDEAMMMITTTMIMPNP